ncbi:hypothetical protein [Nonomuraea dietziae]|uniref:hypothetical protein n=1 Tax=Nonomuraea dietziae TaxID=65515 RepID=UPI00343E7883
MTVSTVVAAAFVVAIAGVVIWMAWSLIAGRGTLRKGSGHPGIPSASTHDAGGYDGSGPSGGDGGGGGS